MLGSAPRGGSAPQVPGSALARRAWPLLLVLALFPETDRVCAAAASSPAAAEIGHLGAAPGRSGRRVPAGATLDETRLLAGRRVRITCENTDGQPLFFDAGFLDGLFIQALADGQAAYEWEFDLPVRATVGTPEGG